MGGPPCESVGRSSALKLRNTEKPMKAAQNAKPRWICKKKEGGEDVNISGHENQKEQPSRIFFL